MIYSALNLLFPFFVIVPECLVLIKFEKWIVLSFVKETLIIFTEKVKAKIFKIPVANKSLEPVREGTTMGQIPENVSTYHFL